LALQGSASCASASCHNAEGLGGYRGREYACALERDAQHQAKDKHVRAYEVLFEPRSRQIEQRLSGLASAQEARPESNVLCLRCHVHPGALAQPSRAIEGVRQLRLEDGVSCEACHGPAERWLAAHFRPGWVSLSAAARRAQGMIDNCSVSGRARACVDCHVGRAGMDVNHDLIAAGHPRLHFEFSSYHYFLHKHWDYAQELRDRPDFEARAWAVGQLASAKAALDLLAVRAESRRGPWPEFAEYDCFSCHHDLKEKSWRQQRGPQGRKAGALVWSDWYYDQLPQAVAALAGKSDPSLTRALEELRQKLSTPRPDRSNIARQARRTAAALGRALTNAEQAPAVLPIAELFQQVAARSATNWDSAAQEYVALSALSRSGRALGQPLAGPALARFQKLLRFPDRYGSPKDFDPDKLYEQLDLFKARGSK
jgi:hypothetical protein